MSTSYDDLAARAERGELNVLQDTVLRGPAAAIQAQRLLMDATGTDNIDDMTRAALGRPSLGSGTSPVVRARVPESLKKAVATIAEQDHRKESDVVRIPSWPTWKADSRRKILSNFLTMDVLCSRQTGNRR